MILQSKAAGRGRREKKKKGTGLERQSGLSLLKGEGATGYSGVQHRPRIALAIFCITLGKDTRPERHMGVVGGIVKSLRWNSPKNRIGGARAAKNHSTACGGELGPSKAREKRRKRSHNQGVLVEKRDEGWEN